MLISPTIEPTHQHADHHYTLKRAPPSPLMPTTPKSSTLTSNSHHSAARAPAPTPLLLREPAADQEARVPARDVHAHHQPYR